MELTHLHQIDFEELRNEKIDCLFSTAGIQNRCLYLAEALAESVPRKILLVCDHKDHKEANIYIQRFADLGFTHHETINENSAKPDRVLDEVCHVSTRQVNIAIDYSCMPKKWYALFIDCIVRNTYPAERINLFLSYTPKIFGHNPEKHGINYFGPMLFNRDNLKDKKPVSMIVSLDHNGSSLNEAINRVKPQKLLAFIPHCSHDPEYSEIVRENNIGLLSRLEAHDIINYPIDRPDEINSILTSRCLDERVNSEVVIITQGPKTFSIVAMLLAVRYPDIKLWEIVFNDNKVNSGQVNAAADPVIIKVSFINDELD